jgi:hypothetical protein
MPHFDEDRFFANLTTSTTSWGGFVLGGLRRCGILTSAQIRRILWVAFHNAAEKPRGSDQPEATTRTVGPPWCRRL